ncbi:MAG: VirB4 family type IV secretion system protein [Solirubrobacteraceae bacterium]
MRVQRPGIRASTRNARAVYPFQAEAGWGWRGCLIGSDSSGGAFCFDPWELYRRELVANPNVAVFGELGYGKSSLMKSLLWRMLLFGRRAFVLDVKGEYTPLCQAVGVQPVRLAPGNGVRLNPLTARRERATQVEILRAVARTAISRPLTPEEAAALREALREVCDHSDVEPTLPRVLELLFSPTTSMATALRSSPTDLVSRVREVALGIQDLCEGPLKGMFDGPTTPGLDLDGRLVVLDLEAVKDSPAIGILMACASGWLSARLERLADRRDPGRLINVADEVWKVLEHEGLAEWFRANFKLTRKYGTLNVIVAHKPADITGSGDQGTTRQAAARGLITDCATRIIYRQAAGEIPACISLFGLSEREAEIITQLQKGQALWQVGNRSFIVQHYRTGLERQLTDTDAGMTADRLDQARTP